MICRKAQADYHMKTSRYSTLHSAFALMWVVAAAHAATDETKQAKPGQAETKPSGGIGNFFKALNKKTADLKDAVDKAAGNEPAATSNATAPQKGAVATSEAPIFDNDSVSSVTRERIQEVISKSYVWGDAGPNTTGFKQVGNPSADKLDGISTLKWGAAKSVCETFLKERGATPSSSGVLKPGTDFVNYEGGSFAGQTVKMWQMIFFKDRLVEAKVEYYYPTNVVLKQYRVMLKELEKKYGKRTGEQDLRFLYLDLNMDYAIRKRNTHDDDEEKHWYYLMVLDSHYANALANKTAQPMARWIFADNNTITLWVSGRFTTLIQYQNKALLAEADAHAQSRSSAEKDL